MALKQVTPAAGLGFLALAVDGQPVAAGTVEDGGSHADRALVVRGSVLVLLSGLALAEVQNLSKKKQHPNHYQLEMGILMKN